MSGYDAKHVYVDEFDWVNEEYDESDEDLDDDYEEVVIIRKKKRGRPKSEIARNNRVELRMTDQELKSLNEMTTRFDISRSDLVRKALVVYNHIMNRH